MAEQSNQRLNVCKWQAARRQFQYIPVLWFFYRMIEVAYLDAKTKHDGLPADEALLARDWIVCSEDAPATAPQEYISFPFCCRILGLDVEAERLALLELIDNAVESDNDEAWARLEDLSGAELKDDVEPLFDAPRVVPALDQIALFV